MPSTPEPKQKKRPPRSSGGPSRSRFRKLVPATVLALVTTLFAFGLRHTPVVSDGGDQLDDVLYDTVYRLRPAEDRTGGDVVIVAVDDRSLAVRELGAWPWRREWWAYAVRFLETSGARAIVFDMLFSERSKWADETNDDDLFADAINAAKVPVIIGAGVGRAGAFEDVAPPLKFPTLGAVEVGDGATYRSYRPLVHGLPSLARATVKAVATTSIANRIPPEAFRLHYYGRSERPGGRRTFTYLSAAHVIAAGMPEPTKTPAELGVPAELFRGKIVLIGTITKGTYDEKTSPLDARVPGVEIQATAIENLLHGQRVHEMGRIGVWSVAFLAAFLASVATIVPRRVSVKLLGAALAVVALLTAGGVLFVGETIKWLPLAGPLVAAGMATVGGIAWSYVTEDRQRRQILRQLAGYVSPAVAARVADDPRMLAPEKREMTVMFTDIAGFTNISEALPSTTLAEMMNFYLGEMAGVILGQDGTIDKFIGDAVMSFWNAPLDQPDHASAACRAALAVVEREREVQDELASLCGAPVMTRIGINSGAMTVGDMGSQRKFNFTVLGDAVNLGSRLEGANKIYGSRVLLAQSTADLVRGRFLMRQLDVLRVPGKKQPIAVFELLAEGDGNETLRRKGSDYGVAFAHYRAQRWDEATAALRTLLADFPDDAPAKALLERVTHLKADPPSADWDGVYVSKTK